MSLIHELTASKQDGTAFTFGVFRLVPAEMLLLEDGTPVELGSRALDILIALVQRAGELVTKEDLIAAAWPSTVVEEANLRVHISALRKALGDGRDGRRYVLTVPGRGYRFVGLSTLPIGAPLNASRLPPAPTRLIGRGDMVQTVTSQLRQRRFVTLVGPGGIGKTALALDIAHRLGSDFDEGICFVDLSNAISGEAAISAIGLALGLALYSNETAVSVLATLRAKHLLVVLDSCERVVDHVGALLERVLKEAPGVHVLATSREPLHAEGERVLRLPPLELPPPSAGLTAAEIGTYPAVQLFVERAAAVLGGFEVTDADATVIAAICSRLDGIALAIELVAGQVGAFDLSTLSALLNDRFRLLARGGRTAMPRHQTMHAALDWSYQLIGEPERILLRRLAVFESAVSLASVREVVGGPGLAGSDVAAVLADLVDKSLVVNRILPDKVIYHLLDTTRAYALDRLVESGEHAEVARRHARHYIAKFTHAHTDWLGQTSSEWVGMHGRDLGNARSALKWAFAAGGDPELGIRLAAAALPVMFELSLAEECRRLATRAIGVLDRLGSIDRHVELKLRLILAGAQMYAPGPLPQTVGDWYRVLELATGLGDMSAEARAIWGLWTAAAYGGRAHEALDFARRYRTLVSDSNPTLPILAERLVGVSECNLGQLGTAQTRLELMVENYVASVHRWQTLGFSVDNGVMARATLARIAWLRGDPDRGRAMAEAALATTLGQAHAISQCYVLLESVLPLAFFVHDRVTIAAGVKLLADLAEQNGLAIWQATARVLWLLTRLTGGAKVQSAVLMESLADLSATGYQAQHGWMSALIAEALGRDGNAMAALTIVNTALARCEANGEDWIIPELIRVKTGLHQQAEATPLLARALALAERQGALAWQLRILLALARLDPDNERVLLVALLDRFDPVAETPDLLEARAFLARKKQQPPF